MCYCTDYIVGIYFQGSENVNPMPAKPAKPRKRRTWTQTFEELQHKGGWNLMLSILEREQGSYCGSEPVIGIILGKDNSLP